MEKSNKQVAGLYTQRLNGLRKYMNGNTKVLVNGESYALSDLVTTYQAGLDARANAMSKRAELKAALTDRTTADDAIAPIEEVLKAWVTTQFGLVGQEALEFGFAPRKKPRARSSAKAAPAPAPAPQGAGPSTPTTS